jgi:alkylation response protein AidB-like acyl-CoA dehydrogenase
MDFAWSEEEERFRAELEGFVETHLPADWDRPPGSLGSSTWTPATAAFAQALAEHGLLVPSWPKEYGGNAASSWQQQIVAEVMWANGEPRGPQYMNVNWIGPALIQFGSAAQREHFLAPMAAGSVAWCQGFSEPDSGSDLASIRTRAERDGTSYIVNGRKIWTSYADTARYCFLLVRTGTEAARHRGLSVLLVPMDSSGIEVRKIPAIVGDHAFHEVTFTDVVVPESARLGEENGGWAVVIRALANERVGLPRYVRGEQILDLVAAWADTAGILDQPRVLALLGEALASCEAARLLVYRVVDERAKGRPPSGLANVARVAAVEAERIVADVVVELMGEEGLVSGGLADVQQRNALAVGLAGGTFEVQLNLISQLVLDLPRSDVGVRPSAEVPERTTR